MQYRNVEGELASQNHLVAKFKPPAQRCELWARNLVNRAEVEPVDGKGGQVHDDCGSEEGQIHLGELTENCSIARSSFFTTV
jgi:hypothetical protein